MNQELVVNLYRPKNPIQATLIEKVDLAPGAELDRECFHLVYQCAEPFPGVPGQSAGILPGMNEETGKPHKLRLYSLANATGGENGNAQHVSLCVVRHFWDNPETGEQNIRGVCSNYLCDHEVGTEVQMTGPAGKHFILPADFATRDLIFVGTGTGIAPFRGMLIDMFAAGYKGTTTLYFGTQYRNRLFYNDEFEALQAHSNFRYQPALSREDTNPDPELLPSRSDRMYVQNKMFADREALKDSLAKDDSLLYLCGLKGMEEGIYQALELIGQESGVEGSYVEQLRQQGRLLVEVY